MGIWDEAEREIGRLRPDGNEAVEEGTVEVRLAGMMFASTAVMSPRAASSGI